MSRDDASLLDIAHAAELALKFIGGLNEVEFYKDEKTQSAVLHQILIIGEAAKRVSREFQQDNPEIPWRLMAGMRDIVIHAYDSVDLSEVWRTATIDLPALLEKIRPLLPKNKPSA
jgi:uncharacterized protein with HEPN domain